MARNKNVANASWQQQQQLQQHQRLPHIKTFGNGLQASKLNGGKEGGIRERWRLLPGRHGVHCLAGKANAMQMQENSTSAAALSLASAAAAAEVDKIIAMANNFVDETTGRMLNICNSLHLRKGN